MTRLQNSLNAWNTDHFSTTLKEELEKLRSDVLPIAHVITQGNKLDDSDLGVIINEVDDDPQQIHVKVGVFFAEVINCVTCCGGNGMHDEAYCELEVTIDKASSEASFKPI
ncbi:MAG: hypothetical protein RPU52_16170 [Candidatus Sedimenticola sp. (ex Thyasira tokunagai)]